MPVFEIEIWLLQCSGDSSWCQLQRRIYSLLKEHISDLLLLRFNLLDVATPLDWNQLILVWKSLQLTMKAEQFMKEHRLDVYFKDVAVSGYQQAVADEDLDSFQAEYFQTVAQGKHVIGRDYAFVTSSAFAQLRPCDVHAIQILTSRVSCGTQM